MEREPDVNSTHSAGKGVQADSREKRQRARLRFNESNQAASYKPASTDSECIGWQ